jgi:hypothetical protein
MYRISHVGFGVHSVQAMLLLSTFGKCCGGKRFWYLFTHLIRMHNENAFMQQFCLLVSMVSYKRQGPDSTVTVTLLPNALGHSEAWESRNYL